MNLNIDIVMMKYNIGKDAQGNETFSFYRERLLKRSRDFRWYGQVHEYMVFDGIIIHTDITITHKKESEDSDRNLKILEKLASQGDEHLSPRDLFYLAKELFHNRRYEEAVRYYEKFLGTENAMPSFYFESCMDLSKYYMEKGEAKKALRVLIRSFEHDLPRAEVCCFIGAYYKENEDYKRAIFWYELALKLEKPKVSWERIMHDCWGFLPCIELCLCFYKLGNMKDAIKYNVMAASYKPNDPIVMKNKEFFENSLRITVEEYTGYKDIPFSDIGCNTDLVVMKKEYENLSLQGNINKTI